MKKTENINLGGNAFTIDVDAYKSLDKYIKSISNKFTRNGSKHDIMEDIEIRMAEVLEENLGTRNILVMQDIDKLKSVMGGPEVFSTDEHAHSYTTDFDEHDEETIYIDSDRRTKRFYRDIDNKAIGGVCAGLAHYFGVGSPTWIRLLFAFVFFMAGSGLFLYLILWIAMPPARTDREIADMRNDPMHIDDIARSIKDEVMDVKENILKN